MFFGDSITEAGRRRPGGNALGEGYVRMIAERTSPAGIVNLGIGGDRVRDLRSRWNDVVAAQPDTLTVLIGINDVWRHFDRDDYTPPDAFAADLRTILDGAHTRGTRAILMEPFLLPVEPGQWGWLSELEEKIGIVNMLGTEYSTPVVPLSRLFIEAAAELDPADLAPDGIHPSPRGHRLIADAWLAVAGRCPISKRSHPGHTARSSTR
ncbi:MULTISPECIES: SGNH/GDSL hydrolase family protein [unclassified Microbacterium]|uniref:SGNH/GDSL hydrolase family protein n=1 Tax=unclassified Microbacterium TaxID=2609290 RepID=UPI0036698A3E